MNLIMKRLFDKWTAQHFNGMSSDEIFSKLKTFYGDTQMLRAMLVKVGKSPEDNEIIELAQDRARKDVDRLYDIFRSPGLTEFMMHHIDRMKWCIENTYWQ